MKKVALCLIIFALLAAGVLIFRTKANQTKDVVIVSQDGNVSIVFAGATMDEVEEHQAYFTTTFTPLSPDNFYENYIANQEYYICSLSEDMEKVEGETGVYLLSKDFHYFYVTVDGTTVTAQEMVAEYYPPEHSCAPLLAVPFLESALPHSTLASVSWEDMILASNWTELIDFYKSIQWPYELDDEVLYLSLCEKYPPEVSELWYERAVKIIETASGIQIELIKDGLPKYEQ